MKKILLLVALTFSFFSTPLASQNTVSAQGTYSCSWNYLPIPRPGGDCYLSDSNDCDPCFSTGDLCGTNNSAITCVGLLGLGAEYDCIAPSGFGECGVDSSDGDGYIGGCYVDSAIGCIPYETTDELMAFILSWGIGVGSGIVFIMVVYAGFLLMTSKGDPRKVQAGKELMTAAISGLLFLLFSPFILRTVGVDILTIFPG